MTLQYYKSLPAIIEAVEGGNPWEYFAGEHYYTPPDQSPETLLSKITNGLEVRLKPAPPAPRWWKCEADVPQTPQGILWITTLDAEHLFLVVGVLTDGIAVQRGRNPITYRWDQLETLQAKWSHDRNRANLKPCQTEGER